MLLISCNNKPFPSSPQKYNYDGMPKGVSFTLHVWPWRFFFLLWQTDSYHECSQCVSWKKRLIRKLFNENWKHFHFQTLDDIETPQLVEATQCTCSVKLQSVYVLLVLYTCVFMFVCLPTLFSVLSNQFCTTQSVIWWVIDVILVR